MLTPPAVLKKVKAAVTLLDYLSGWDLQFVENLAERYEVYGSDTLVSAKQEAQIDRIISEHSEQLSLDIDGELCGDALDDEIPF